MGSVTQTNILGDNSISLHFEEYEDFVKYNAPVVKEELPKYTLTLTEKESYILQCVMGNVRYNGNEHVTSLLEKVSDNVGYELDTEDYDKVKFTVDCEGYTTIEYMEGE